MESPAQVGVVGGHAARGRRGLVAGARAKAYPKCRADAARDVVLEGEDVLGLPIVAVRPDLPPRRDLGEAGRDAHAVVRALNAALEQVRRSELPAGPLRIDRDHHQAAGLGQLGADRLGDSGREVLVAGRAGQVPEGHDGERASGRGRVGARRRPARGELPCEQRRQAHGGDREQHRPPLFRGGARGHDGPRLRADRLVAHALEIADEVAGPRVTVLGILGQAALDDPGQLGRRSGRGAGQRLRLLVENGAQRGHRRRPGEGPSGAQHLVEHPPERELVGAEVHRLSASLLGRHVAHRAQHRVGVGDRCGGSGGTRVVVAGRQLGEAEVEDLHEAVPRDHHVFGFQVAVNDPGPVGLGQAGGHLHGHVEGPAEGRRAGGEHVAQRLPLHQLHDDEEPGVGSAHVVDSEDVRMVQGGGRARLLFEAAHTRRMGGHRRGQQLDRHLAAQAQVAGAEHLAHAAGAEEGQHLVGTEPRAGADGQGRRSRGGRAHRSAAVSVEPAAGRDRNTTRTDPRRTSSPSPRGVGPVMRRPST